ncbi:DUF4148 domain-containing protein [Pulveribacter sp.]|uniref:DUF4148 domain-containing protein n=1 Tax=Pulveribacter sp. TaxID=2678893 RepID=UPI00289D0229|nr:DUF4148 domain-containing protein [Pulveribacter sp.]
MKNIALRSALAVAAVSAAALSAPAFAQEAAQQAPGLSRAEVLADLALHRRAGLDAQGSSEILPVGNADYERRLAEYQRLRSGPEYLAEVRRFGGAPSTVAGEAGTQRVQ